MKLFLIFVWFSVQLSAAYAQYDPKDYNAFNGKTEVAFHDDLMMIETTGLRYTHRHQAEEKQIKQMKKVTMVL